MSWIFSELLSALAQRRFALPISSHDLHLPRSSETMASKPTIVLVHGAWSLPEPSYTPLKSQLEGLGYEVHLPTLFTSGGGEVKGKTWKEDVEDILDVSIPLFDQGKEVVLICHSYGGVPAITATEGQSVEERTRKGKAGGFKQIILVAAFAIPQKNMDLLTLFGGKWPLWADFAPAYTGVCLPLKIVQTIDVNNTLPQRLMVVRNKL